LPRELCFSALYSGALQNSLKGILAIHIKPLLCLYLQALHTLFAREHNRLAKQIKSLAIHKDDQVIMKEARRYVIAQLHNIVYNEFLPSVLPNSAIQKYNLNVDEDSVYDENVSSTIFVEFNTAAYRYGHFSVLSSFHETYPYSLILKYFLDLCV
jgi:hypothetical protein